MQNILPIPALRDNYIWMLIEPTSKQACVVDPGEAAPVIAVLESKQLKLSSILLTHHHADHSGGITELLDYAGKIPVYGSHRSQIAAVNHPVKEGDVLQIAGLSLTAMEIPGHTLDHTAYYQDGTLLFSGDTLFSAGCGRIFEGDPAMMYQSLTKLLQLNDTTKLYCGHEYTLANLNFAQHVEPNNQAILSKIKQASLLAADGGCTLPSPLHDEKLYNPFLRCTAPTVIHAAEIYANKSLPTPLEVFATLREWKNGFKG